MIIFENAGVWDVFSPVERLRGRHRLSVQGRETPPPERRRGVVFVLWKMKMGSWRKLAQELWFSSLELQLESSYDAAVHLAYPTFTQIERIANFFHGEFFIIVEYQD